jgi:hypothetical protein
MTQTRQAGDYIMAVGGKAGAVYINGRWQRYECNTCARAAGLLVRRIGTNDSATASKVALDKTKPAVSTCTCHRI